MKLDATPRIDIIKRVPGGKRLGVFSSSFNPPTIAHLELVKRAAKAFNLDEILALAGRANADKTDYECSLEDRLAMLNLAFAESSYVSTGVSSHAFYVDMIDALELEYPAETNLHFIVGFDTFERVLDPGDQYTKRYHRDFNNRSDALKYLFARSSLIVAGRSGAGLQSFKTLVENEAVVPPSGIKYLDFPLDLGEVSATQAREFRRSGQSIEGLVPQAVKQYIEEHGLYST